MQKTTIKKLNDFILSPEEDAKFMANIDMDALIEGVKKSQQEISEGKGISFEEAMAQIDKEVFSE